MCGLEGKETSKKAQKASFLDKSLQKIINRITEGESVEKMATNNHGEVV